MKTTYIYLGVVIALFVLVVFFARSSGTVSNPVAANPEYDNFSQCLADAGAQFFGAFWCPHCQAQKAALQNSANIPYIECSTPNGEGQTRQCADEGITGYPTWKFADGTSLSGEQSLATLGEKTNCAVPTI